MLDDVLEVHFLELPKLDLNPERTESVDEIDGGTGNDNNNEKSSPEGDVTLTDWARFIRAENREELEALAKKNPTLEYAYEILRIANMDKEKRMLYEAREKQILDEKSIAYEFGEGKRIAIEKAVAAARIAAIKEGYEKGREEGREEGREKSREEGREEGREKSREEGREEGINLAKKACILRMHNIGRHVEEISNVAECSISEVEQVIAGECKEE